jgi:large subunit ribosomal protein L30
MAHDTILIQWRVECETMAKLRITYTKSSIGYNARQRATVQALGLRKLHQVVEHADTPVIRGMINKVSHLVRVEEVAE